MIDEVITHSGKKNSNRYRAITQKIGREVTGLNSALFVHIDFDAQLRPTSVSFSSKWKDERTIDLVLEALGQTVTTIITEVRQEAAKATEGDK